MSEPTVTVVKDGDGLVHHFSSDSKMMIAGLADGTYSRIEEVSHAATVSGDSDDHDARAVDAPSGDGQPGPRTADGGDKSSADKPKPRR